MLDAATIPGRLRRLAEDVPVRRRWLPPLTLAAAAVVQMVMSLVLTHGTWFTLDSVEFLTHRGSITPGATSIFAPWGGHWQTIPILLYKLLFIFFGMHTLVPYIVMGILVHLGLCALLYLVLVRSGLSRWYSAIATLLVMFCGVGAEAFVWDAVMPLVLALALGLAAVLACQYSGFSQAGLRGASALLTVSLVCSGAAFTGLAFFAVYLLCNRPWRDLLRVVSVPAVLYILWFAFFGHDEPRLSVSGIQPFELPRYVWIGMSNVYGTSSGIPDSGAVLMLAVIAGAFLIRDVPEQLRYLAWAGIVGAIVQMVLSGLGGLGFGYGSAVNSRYMYIVFLMLSPALFICVRWIVLQAGATLGNRPVVLTAVALPLLAAYLLNGVLLSRDAASFRHARGEVYRAWALGTVASVDDGERILTPHPVGIEGVTDARLFVNERIRRALPNDRATDQQRLDAESQFFVGVRPDKEYGLFAPADMRFEDGFTAAFQRTNGCTTYTVLGNEPTLVLPLGDSNEFSVKSDATKVTTELRRDGLISTNREWSVTPGDPLHIASTAKHAELVATFDQPGDYLICTN